MADYKREDTASWNAEQVRQAAGSGQSTPKKRKRRRNGCLIFGLKFILWVVFVLVASAILASVGWMLMNDLCAFNKEDITATVEVTSEDNVETVAVKLKEAGEAGRLNFIGNIEGKEAILGGADVIVADGFTGNIMLKTLEGMGSYFAKTLKSVFTKNLLIKLGALTVKSDIKAFKAKVDINEVGGTALLGISKPVIKAHGSSTAKAFCSAIRQAKMFAESSIISEIEKNVEFMKVEKE